MSVTVGMLEKSKRINAQLDDLVMGVALLRSGRDRLLSALVELLHNSHPPTGPNTADLYQRYESAVATAIEVVAAEGIRLR